MTMNATTFLLGIAESLDEAEILGEMSPEEHVLANVDRFQKFLDRNKLQFRTTPVNLFGFGTVDALLMSEDNEKVYVSAFVAGTTLGMTPKQIEDWCFQERQFACLEQRWEDEENETLGYDIVDNQYNLGFAVYIDVDDPEVYQQADGRRVVSTDVYLLEISRLMSLTFDSPWGEEFLKNAKDTFKHAYKDSPIGEVLGEPEVDEEEAKRKFLQGPSFDF